MTVPGAFEQILCSPGLVHPGGFVLTCPSSHRRGVKYDSVITVVIILLDKFSLVSLEKWASLPCICSRVVLVCERNRGQLWGCFFIKVHYFYIPSGRTWKQRPERSSTFCPGDGAAGWKRSVLGGQDSHGLQHVSLHFSTCGRQDG